MCGRAAAIDASSVNRLLAMYCALGAPVLVLAAATGSSDRWDAVPWVAASTLAAAAIATGMRTYRPADRSFWLALGGAELAWVVAGAVSLSGGLTQHSASYSPSALLYVPGYVFLGAGTIVLLR